MISKKDRDALRRCLQQVEADPAWNRNFARRKADGESWLDRAFGACGILQTRNLKLLPWQIAPCCSHPHPLDHLHFHYHERKLEAAKFADQLRCAGLSIYESNPPHALAAAAEAQHGLGFADRVSNIPNKNNDPDAA